MSSSDKIVEVLRPEWPQLRDMYKSHLSDGYIAYYLMDTYIRWFDQDSKIENIKVFCLNSDYSDGTFVAIDTHHVYADTLNASDQNLIPLLGLLDYTKGRQIDFVRSELNAAVCQVIRMKNLKLDQSNTGTAMFFHLPAEEILKFDFRVPDDIVLRPLNEKYVEFVNKNWSHNYVGSVECLKRLAKYNQNIGAFTKNDGELVAWVLRYQPGPLCALQKAEYHRGEGLGTLVTKFILKQIALMGHDGYAEIIETNRVSKEFFERLGFKPVGHVNWYETIPIEWEQENS